MGIKLKIALDKKRKYATFQIKQSEFMRELTRAFKGNRVADDVTEPAEKAFDDAIESGDSKSDEDMTPQTRAPTVPPAPLRPDGIPVPKPPKPPPKAGTNCCQVLAHPKIDYGGTPEIVKKCWADVGSNGGVAPLSASMKTEIMSFQINGCCRKAIALDNDDDDWFSANNDMVTTTSNPELPWDLQEANPFPTLLELPLSPVPAPNHNPARMSKAFKSSPTNVFRHLHLLHLQLLIQLIHLLHIRLRRLRRLHRLHHQLHRHAVQLRHMLTHITEEHHSRSNYAESPIMAYTRVLDTSPKRFIPSKCRVADATK